MKQPKNPYVIGNSVGNSSAFVGRTDILKEVLNVLRHDNQNAIVLFGQRRIGKTSVLRELEAKLPEKGNFLPVFFDLQDKAKLSLAALLQELANTIIDSLPNSTSSFDLDDDPETTFRDIWLPNVLKTLPTGKSLVVLFDELDVLAAPNSEQADVTFFPYLDNLLQKIDRQRLSFVFAIGRNLKYLSHIARHLFRTSLFKLVSLLRYDDTVKLIRFSEANHTLEWSDDAIEQVWKVTNGHPLITQCLCYSVWEAAYNNHELNTAVTSEKVEAAIPNTLERINNAIAWLWDGLEAAERLVMSTLASAGIKSMTDTQINALLKEKGVLVIIPELEHAPHVLKDWDLFEKAESDSYRFRVELLRRWVKENEPISRVREEIDNIDRKASEYYRTGIKLYEREQWDEACKYLREALDKNPNHAKASNLLANILLEQGQVDKSCKEMSRLYKYQPLARQSRFIQLLLNLAKSKNDEYEKLKLYTKIRHLDPDNEEVIEVQWEMQRNVFWPRDKIPDWYNKAIKAQQNGQIKEAQTLLARIIAIDPTHVKAISTLYFIETGTPFTKGMKFENYYVILSLITIVTAIIALVSSVVVMVIGTLF